MKVIGIDIGGTSVKGVVCDREGRSLAETRRPTDARAGREAILASVASTVEALLGDHPEAAAIGIGTAGRVNAADGIVVYATDNLPGWQGMNLKAWAEAAFGRPAFADNDANAALLGESWIGAARGLRDVVMLTLGTGVGGANMAGGELIRGANWSGGEWGHAVLVPEGTACNCGRSGCIEQYLSGTALVRLASEAAGRPYPSGLDVLNAAAAGERPAQETVDRFVFRLAVAAGNIANGLDPEAIVIGGGVVDAHLLWWPAFRSALAHAGSHADVRPALLGNRAGMLGAAKLALDGLSGGPAA